jgi:hypothetical protein
MKKTTLGSVALAILFVLATFVFLNSTIERLKTSNLDNEFDIKKFMLFILVIGIYAAGNILIEKLSRKYSSK